MKCRFEYPPDGPYRKVKVKVRQIGYWAASEYYAVSLQLSKKFLLFYFSSFWIFLYTFQWSFALLSAPQFGNCVTGGGTSNASLTYCVVLSRNDRTMAFYLIILTSILLSASAVAAQHINLACSGPTITERILGNVQTYYI